MRGHSIVLCGEAVAGTGATVRVAFTQGTLLLLIEFLKLNEVNSGTDPRTWYRTKYRTRAGLPEGPGGMLVGTSGLLLLIYY